MKIGLYIGRFQPFHLGHLSAVKQALKKVDFLTIGIGSSQLNNQKNNPFKWEDRKEMIERSIAQIENHESKIEIMAIPDINNDEKWPAHVRSLIPDFDIIFIGNDGVVNQLFTKYDDVPIVKVKEEIPICATKIRELMRNGGDWEQYVTKEVAQYIKDIVDIGHWGLG